MKKIQQFTSLVILLLGLVSIAWGQNPNREIIEAAQAGDIAKVEGILAQGRSVHSTDEATGKTALHYAAGSGNTALLKVLLKEYVAFNVDKTVYQNLPEAEKKERMEKINFFFLDKNGESALVDALKGGHVEVVRLLLEAEFMTPDVVNKPNNGNKSNPLFVAVEKGDLAMVQLLLNNGADVKMRNSLGQTALHLVNGRVDIAKALLDKGADINAKTTSGYSTLVTAAEYTPTEEFIKWLLDNGADANAGGPSALFHHMRALKKSVEVTRLLLDKGANVNFADAGGTTVLHQAVFGASPEIVKLLLDRGANISAKNKDGDDPLMLAIKHNRAQTVEMLKAKKAQ